MTVQAPRVSDCSEEGPFGVRLTGPQLSGFIQLTDLWPLDTLVLGQGIICRFDGDGHWSIINTKTGKRLGRRKDPRL